ncbi:glycoside hydrolase [Hysterangium stoloniferum]|nr:glycoside hydrolase [Hysterangium stoloniferum]
MPSFKSFIDRFKDSTSKVSENYLTARALDERDVYRYRRQYGVNLGSWFVLEKWICGDPFKNADSPGSSDFDVAKGRDARAVLERHWDTWITTEDWEWIAARGLNSVRLPIGYYHLYAKDPSVVQGTPFSDLGAVFEGAWPRIMHAVQKASTYGIGVLIDLHAAPGKQNGDSHSGVNGQVEFHKRANLSRTIHVLKLLATTFADMPNVIGLELVNEPQNRDNLYDWYECALNTIREAVGQDLPLYIGDAWNTHQYASLIQKRQDFTVLDHHLYRCFTHEDQQLTGDQHAAALPPGALVDCSSKTRGNLVVAEFSAALNPNSIRSSDPAEQDRQRRVFARAELKTFRQCCGGWWFWTYKKDGWDAGWSLRDAVRAEVMPERFGLLRASSRPNDEGRRDAECSKRLSEHQTYWSKFKSSHGYEHWRFELGFKKGWDDAFLFFSFSPKTVVETSVSEIGFIGQWLQRRIAEHLAEKGNSKYVWEFEHGFQQGAKTAMEFFCSDI